MADIKALKSFREQHNCSLWVARQVLDQGLSLDEALAAERAREQESAALMAADAAATRERRLEDARQLIEREQRWARVILADLEKGALKIERESRKGTSAVYDAEWGREVDVPDWTPVIVVQYSTFGEWVRPDRGQTDEEALRAFAAWVRHEEKRRIDDIRRAYQDVL